MSDVTDTVRLTEWTSCGGCAAKWGASLLESLVGDLASAAPAAMLASAAPAAMLASAAPAAMLASAAPAAMLASAAPAAMLVGLAPSDDAAVYRLTEDVALVSTTDFFPPLVDDPADFGAIAAANACSDVFAMGGRVVLALNVAAFPETLPIAAITAILTAASEVVVAAGGRIAGGHTIRSEEPIFGLAVQGTVHPDRVWTKAGARPGDALVLSKPIGTGIVLAGGDGPARAAAVARIRELNRDAAEALSSLDDGPHAVTDVTGYGLAGHGWEMAERSDAALDIDVASVPLYAGALDAAAAGTRTGGDRRNREHLAGRVSGHVDAAHEALMYDPQTSGGLLAAVTPESVEGLAGAGFVRIGTVRPGPAQVRLS